MSILYTDDTVEDFQKPAEFFTDKWLMEILGDDIKSIVFSPTQALVYGHNSRFLNRNANDFIRNLESKPTIRGPAIIAPKDFRFVYTVTGMDG